MGDKKKGALDSLIDFIFSDDTPVSPEDEGDLDIFKDAIQQADARLAKSRLSALELGPFLATCPAT
ncbi:hypothetical protein A4U53_003855 (plasmid) [Rhizobium ruizarguesonis]|uniref:Uncharacterized protein n=1 Tax=Rhizobium ruizarguesonis TaxID=2081791 RepID=A0ACD5EGL4_9HYPH